MSECDLRHMQTAVCSRCGSIFPRTPVFRRQWVLNDRQRQFAVENHVGDFFERIGPIENKEAQPAARCRIGGGPLTAVRKGMQVVSHGGSGVDNKNTAPDLTLDGLFQQWIVGAPQGEGVDTPHFQRHKVFFDDPRCFGIPQPAIGFENPSCTTGVVDA